MMNQDLERNVTLCLQKQGDECRSSTLLQTKGRRAEVLEDCLQQRQNIIYNLMITASKSNKGNNVELPGWGPEDWVEPGSCLAKVCRLEGHMCGDLDCVKTLAKQHKQLLIIFGNIVMKTKTETELIVGYHGGTEVNLVTALGFYSMFGSLESLLNLEQKHRDACGNDRPVSVSGGGDEVLTNSRKTRCKKEKD